MESSYYPIDNVPIANVNKRPLNVPAINLDIITKQ